MKRKLKAIWMIIKSRQWLVYGDEMVFHSKIDIVKVNALCDHLEDAIIQEYQHYANMKEVKNIISDIN